MKKFEIVVTEQVVVIIYAKSWLLGTCIKTSIILQTTEILKLSGYGPLLFLETVSGHSQVSVHYLISVVFFYYLSIRVFFTHDTYGQQGEKSNNQDNEKNT